MSFEKSLSKMLSYLASCDPYSNPHSYYIPYPPEESENQTTANNDTKI